ncbi:MAG: hypothetical protein K1X48_11525 [Burkholderiaceae bacterium]|nr:hypothetical protein [Burkholderiaceae bacterium]
MLETFEAIFTEDIAIEVDSFIINYEQPIRVRWDEIQFVAAVHRIDAIAIDDVFFWAVISSAVPEHLWITMAIESPKNRNLQAFENELCRRGFAPRHLPEKSVWQKAGRHSDQMYVSVCVYPPRCAGMPFYELQVQRWFPLKQFCLKLAIT